MESPELNLGQWLFALQCSFRQSTNFVVFSISRHGVVAFQDTACVSIHDKDRVVARVEKNGIRCLGSDAFLCKQLGP